MATSIYRISEAHFRRIYSTFRYVFTLYIIDKEKATASPTYKLNILQK